jgi:hypothetical protein
MPIGPRSRRPHPRQLSLARNGNLSSSVFTRRVVSIYLGNRVINAGPAFGGNEESDH